MQFLIQCHGSRDLGQLALPALHFDETFGSDHRSVTFTIGALLLAVYVGKFIFSDWATAWTAGSCLAALMGLYINDQPPVEGNF